MTTSTRKLQPSASGPDARLRSSCDRCHELKNRCARVGGPDSRCERCDRLDIDCVYSSNARIGRPPGTNQKNSRERDRQEGNPRPAKRQGTIARQRQSSHHSLQPSLPDDMDPGQALDPDLTLAQATYIPTSQSPANDKTAKLHLHLPDDPIPNSDPFGQAVHSWLDEHHILGADEPPPLYDWAQPDDPAAHLTHPSQAKATGFFDKVRSGARDKTSNRSLSGFDDLFPDPMSLVIDQGLPAPAKTHTVASDTGHDLNQRTPDEVDHLGGSLALHQRLLQLQNHLGDVAAKYHDAHLPPHRQIPDDEALAATKSLLDMTQAFLSLGSQPHHLPAVLRQSSKSPCHVGILQLLTCYAYLLQILDPTVARLVRQMDGRSSSVSAPSTTPSLVHSGGMTSDTIGSTPSPRSPTRMLLDPGNDMAMATPALRIGRFSFASQPSLGAELLLRSIYRMIAETHNNVNLLAFGQGGMTDGMEREAMAEPSEGIGPTDNSTGSHAISEFNPVIQSARAVVSVTHAQKRALFQRMQHLIDA